MIYSDELATPIGPFPAGAVYGNLVYLSGCVGQDPKTGLLVGDTIEEQARQALKNLLTAVKAGGANQNIIIKVNCYLVTMKDFVPFNEVYKKVFGENNCPARTCVAVAGLPLDARLEMEAVAFKP